MDRAHVHAKYIAQVICLDLLKSSIAVVTAKVFVIFYGLCDACIVTRRTLKALNSAAMSGSGSAGASIPYFITRMAAVMLAEQVSRGHRHPAKETRWATSSNASIGLAPAFVQKAVVP